MEPGELELRKAFEETATRNVRAAVDHGNETRKLLREAEIRISQLETSLMQQKKLTEDFRQILSQLQAKLYLNGIL